MTYSNLKLALHQRWHWSQKPPQTNGLPSACSCTLHTAPSVSAGTAHRSYSCVCEFRRTQRRSTENTERHEAVPHNSSATCCSTQCYTSAVSLPTPRRNKISQELMLSKQQLHSSGDGIQGWYRAGVKPGDSKACLQLNCQHIALHTEQVALLRKYCSAITAWKQH